jgi:hypothetical protein
MEPSKVEAPSRIMRKIRSATRSPQEPTMEVENPTQPEGVVDVDTIPSLVIEPVSPIVVEE